MSKSLWFAFVLLAFVFSVAAVGCGSTATTEKKPPAKPEEGKVDPKVKANLAKLDAEDQKLAEAQRVCPITGEELGSMGVPVKVMLKDEPVFLCCKMCKDKAEADPEGTLAKAKEAKEK